MPNAITCLAAREHINYLFRDVQRNRSMSNRSTREVMVEFSTMAADQVALRDSLKLSVTHVAIQATAVKKKQPGRVRAVVESMQIPEIGGPAADSASLCPAS